LLESQLTSLYSNNDDRDVMQHAIFSILPPRGSWKFMHKLTVRQTRWFKLRVSLYCRRARQPVAADCLADGSSVGNGGSIDGDGLPVREYQVEHPWEWCDKVSSTAFVVHTTRLRDKVKQKRECSLAAERDKGTAPMQSAQQSVLMDDGNNYEMAPSFVKRQKVSEKDGIRASTENPTRTGMVGPEGFGPEGFGLEGFGPEGFGPGTFPITDGFPRIACVDGEWGTYEECKSAADVLALAVAMPHEESPSPAPRLWALEISPTTKFVGSTVLEATVVVLCIYSNRLRELLYEQPELGYDPQGYDWHTHRILTMFCVLFGVIISTKMVLKQAGLQHKHAALSPCGGALVLSPCAWWCVVELVRAFVVQMEWWSFAEVLGGHATSTTDFGL
jgi:hypothetical protein